MIVIPSKVDEKIHKLVEKIKIKWKIIDKILNLVNNYKLLADVLKLIEYFFNDNYIFYK